MAALLCLSATATLAQGTGAVKITGESMQFGETPGVVVFSENVKITGRGMEITCDQATQNRNTGVVTALGNVIIKKDGALLTADSVRYNSKTDDVEATGNVLYAKDGQDWAGPQVTGNFTTGKWSFGSLETFFEPFHIITDNSERVQQGHFRAHKATITTCDPSDKEFYITAKVADVYSERILQAKGVVFRLRGIPIMYLPSYTVDLDREATNFDFLPGYSSRSGAFALTAYTWYLDDTFSTTTHLDYRSSRGLGLGQDLEWHDRSKEKAFGGGIYAYYSGDDEPYKSVEQEMRERSQGIDIDDTRWRLRLSHWQTLSETDSLYAELNKMSDPEVIRDFFDEEYRLAPEPENRVAYVHTDRHVQWGLEVQRELNDEFFGKVNRLPEGRFEVSRVRLGDSKFFYESFSSGGFLEQAFSDFQQDEMGFENYDSGRVHSEHTVLMPNRIGGFLNVIPRAGYKGTYYTETRGQSSTSTNVSEMVDANGLSTFNTNVVNRVSGGDAELRNIVELGFETSFKAFKVLDDGAVGLNRTGLRHVVEPFADYTLIPEPNLRPEELHQFDEIDRLDERNDVRIGLRNKLQTKTKQIFYNDEVQRTDDFTSILDIIDLEVAARFELDPEDEEESLSGFDFDAELRPSQYLALDSRGLYDNNLGELSQVNTQLTLFGNDQSNISMEHVYQVDIHNVLQAAFELWPEQKFSLEGYTRYDIDEGESEENMLLITTKTDCVGYGLGVRWNAGDVNLDTNEADDDDIRAWVQIWLLALPKSQLKMGD